MNNDLYNVIFFNVFLEETSIALKNIMFANITFATLFLCIICVLFAHVIGLIVLICYATQLGFVGFVLPFIGLMCSSLLAILSIPTLGEIYSRFIKRKKHKNYQFELDMYLTKKLFNENNCKTLIEIKSLKSQCVTENYGNPFGRDHDYFTDNYDVTIEHFGECPVRYMNNCSYAGTNIFSSCDILEHIYKYCDIKSKKNLFRTCKSGENYISYFDPFLLYEIKYNHFVNNGRVVTNYYFYKYLYENIPLNVERDRVIHFLNNCDNYSKTLIRNEQMFLFDDNFYIFKNNKFESGIGITDILYFLFSQKRMFVLLK